MGWRGDKHRHSLAARGIKTKEQEVVFEYYDETAKAVLANLEYIFADEWIDAPEHQNSILIRPYNYGGLYGYVAYPGIFNKNNRNHFYFSNDKTTDEIKVTRSKSYDFEGITKEEHENCKVFSYDEPYEAAAYIARNLRKQMEDTK